MSECNIIQRPVGLDKAQRAAEAAKQAAADAATFDWSSATNEFRRCRENGEGETLPLSDRDAFAAELEYFAGCVAKKVQPERCPPRQSAQQRQGQRDRSARVSARSSALLEPR